MKLKKSNGVLQPLARTSLASDGERSKVVRTWLGEVRYKKLRNIQNEIHKLKEVNALNPESVTAEDINEQLLNVLGVTDEHGVSLMTELMMIAAKDKPEIILNYIKELTKTEKTIKANKDNKTTQVFAPVIITTPQHSAQDPSISSNPAQDVIEATSRPNLGSALKSHLEQSSGILDTPPQ